MDPVLWAGATTSSTTFPGSLDGPAQLPPLLATLASNTPVPLHLAAFLGVSILCFGFINTYRLPRLLAMPLILHILRTDLPTLCTCHS